MHACLTVEGLRAVIHDFGLEVALECRIEVLEALARAQGNHVVTPPLLNTYAALELVRLRTPIIG